MKKIFQSIILAVLTVSTVMAGDPPLTAEQEVSNNCLTIADVDITATGMSLGCGDDVAFPLTLPFAFTFPGGTTTTDIAVATNGYISSDPADTGPDLSNDCPLPSPPSTGSGARLYPLHDDTDVECGIGEVFSQALDIPHPAGVAASSVVIYYDNMAHFPGGAGAPVWDMAVVLWDNGDFAYVYDTGNPEDGSGSTTGVQNEAADQGNELGTTCNTPGAGFGSTITSICVLSPPVEIVPTMGEWGIICLMILMMIVTIVAVRREDLALAYAKK